MTVLFDADTREALLSALKEKSKSAVRLMIKGFGWGGPTLGVVLDEQRDDDEVLDINGLKIVAESDIAFIFQDAKIIQRQGVFGSTFEVFTLGNPTGSTCG